MKTAVADTSLAAYRSLSDEHYLQPKERQIMAAFADTSETALTRKQLARAVDMELSSVCGRVKSLLEKKALCVRGFYVDAKTRKRQELVGPPVD